MFNKNYSEAAVEVLDILNHMNAKDLAKVSKKFITFLNENASRDYICNLDYSKKLNDMDLKKETRGLLAVMYRSYWCPEEELEDLQAKLYENEQKYQNELREKYNPDNIFKKHNKIEKLGEEKIEENNLNITMYKESFFKKIINKIKKFFNKNNNK